MITLCNIGYTKAEAQHKEAVDDIHQYVMGDNRDTDTTSRVFVSGMSNHQIAENEAEAERDRERVRRANQSESYTGQGRDIEIVGDSWEQCVIYFKRQKGISASLGYAGYITPNSQTPEGGVGVLESNHISLSIALLPEGVRVRESNWIRGKITERTIPYNQVRGYLI